jgi:hypothetical protein
MVKIMYLDSGIKFTYIYTCINVRVCVYIIYHRENEENRSTGDFIKRMQRTYFPRASLQTGFE